MFNNICYENTSIINGENENDLEILLFQFSKAWHKCNVGIVEENTKSIGVFLEPIICELMI